MEVGAVARVVAGFFGEDDSALLGSFLDSAPVIEVDDFAEIPALIAEQVDELYTLVVSATFVPSTEGEFIFRIESQHVSTLFVDGRAVLADQGCWTPSAGEVAVWLTAAANLTLIAGTCGGYNNVQFAWKGGAQRQFTTSALPFFRPASQQKLSANLTCSAGCPLGWIHFFGRCFIVPAMEAKADVAAAHCRRVGGNLAVIENDIQNQALHALTGGQGPMWIGLQRPPGESFVFADGSPFLWGRWALNNPSISTDCVQMQRAGPHPSPTAEQWFSASCDGPPTPFACSRQAAPTAGSEACTDDDACLQGKPGWVLFYTCSRSTPWCSGKYALELLCGRESWGTCPSKK
jgi:hypothetical protein